MKTINKKDYHNEGIFINLDTTFSSYENLLNNHNMYLKKDKKYYIYCSGGYKAKKVTEVLSAYGYDVTFVQN